MKKLFLAGVGAISLSKEKTEKIVNELVKQGQLQEKEGRELVEDLLAKASVVRKEIEQKIQQQVKTVSAQLQQTGLAQVKKMEARLRELERRLEKQAGKPAAGKARAAGPKSSAKRAR